MSWLISNQTLHEIYYALTNILTLQTSKILAYQNKHCCKYCVIKICQLELAYTYIT